VTPPIIDIDGPSGAGKGTVARAIARELGYRYVDSGAMYRAIGWKALQAHVAMDDEEGVAKLAEQSQIELEGATVCVDGVDITRAIRTPEIDQAAAAVAKLPRVRAVLVERQRQLGQGGALVMEGRDIGTVVFPDAPVKIYLDAEPEERARRRATDLTHSSSPTTMAEVVSALAARDLIDRTRSASPLHAAADAVRVDTTHRSIEEVVSEVLRLVRGRQRSL